MLTVGISGCRNEDAVDRKDNSVCFVVKLGLREGWYCLDGTFNFNGCDVTEGVANDRLDGAPLTDGLVDG